MSEWILYFSTGLVLGMSFGILYMLRLLVKLYWKMEKLIEKIEGEERKELKLLKKKRKSKRK